MSKNKHKNKFIIPEHFENKNLKKSFINSSFIEKTNSTNKLHPAFCFKYLSKENDYHIPKEFKQSKSFIATMRILGSMTWEQIHQDSHRKYGTEKIPIKSISKDVLNNPRIKEILTEDISDVEVFRIEKNGTSRLIGLRNQKIFYVFAIDFMGKAYNHGS